MQIDILLETITLVIGFLSVIVKGIVLFIAISYGYRYITGNRNKEPLGTLTHNFRMFVVCMLLYLM